jgi:hypothetical protein
MLLILRTKLTFKNILFVYVWLTALWGTIGWIPRLFRYYYKFWTHPEFFFKKIMYPFLYTGKVLSTLPFAYYFYGIIFMIATYLFALWTVKSYKEVKEGYSVFKSEKDKARLFAYKYLLKWLIKFYIYSMSFIVTFLVSMTVYGLVCGFLT